MLRTILFYSYFWLSLAISTPVVAIFAIITLLGLRQRFEWLISLATKLWARSVVWATGARVLVEGLERIPARGGICLVGNHQGSLEIPILLASLPRAPGFVAKREAAFMPFLNMWILALGGSFIDRKNARRARASIERGAKRLRDGAIMIIYPEGTRSRGDRLGEFKRGSFKLATMAEVPVLPVTIDGSWRVWEEKKRIRPAAVRFTIHEPIHTAGMGPEERKALPDRVRAIVASALPGGGA